MGGRVVAGQLKQQLHTRHNTCLGRTGAPTVRKSGTRAPCNRSKGCHRGAGKRAGSTPVRQAPTRTSFSESPLHLLMMDEAEMLKKVVLHSVATALASSV